MLSHSNRHVAMVLTETTVPNLLSALCSTDMQPRQHLELQQALFKQFAEIIDFTLKFDDLKVTQVYFCFLFHALFNWATFIPN